LPHPAPAVAGSIKTKDKKIKKEAKINSPKFKAQLFCIITISLFAIAFHKP
jgi:hypothetical protein